MKVTFNNGLCVARHLQGDYIYYVPATLSQLWEFAEQLRQFDDGAMESEWMSFSCTKGTFVISYSFPS